MKTLGFPREPWLLNQLTEKSWPMKQVQPFVVENTITVDTGGRLDRNPLRRTVLDVTVKCDPDHSVIVGGIYAQLPDFKQHDRSWITDRLGRAKLYLSIDGEDVLSGHTFGGAMCADHDDMLGGGWRFDPDVDSSLLRAVQPIGHDMSKGYDAVGLFLVKGSIVRAHLTGIPSGAGQLRITVGCISALYEVAE